MQEYTPGAFNNLAQQFRSIVPDSEIDFERIIAENVAAQRSEIEGPTTEELKSEFVATMHATKNVFYIKNEISTLLKKN